MKRFILLALCAAILPAVQLRAAEHTKDSIATVKKNLDGKKAVLIDVREKGEWEEGHLKEARLVPLSEIVAGKKDFKLPKDLIIYCHCRSGGRVLRATDILRQQGYDVRPLKFGFSSLLQKGFEQAEKE